MEAKPKRKPLSDRTNLPKFTSPGRHKPSSLSITSVENSVRYEDIIGSSAFENPRSTRTVPSDRPVKRVSADWDTKTIDDPLNAEEKGKGKIIIVPLSCPPVARAGSFEDKLKRKHKDSGKLKICPVPDTKSKKKRRYKVPGGVEKHKLSQDFIDKQRTYFKEIDDFELQVEAVSEGEME